MSLELKYIKQQTLAQDDTVINEEEEVSSGPLEASYNLISERKKLIFYFDNVMGSSYTLQELEGAFLYVNFAMFLPVGFIYSEPSGAPQSGFNLRLPSSLAGAERTEMFFYSNGATTPQANKNLRCWFLGSQDPLNTTTEFGIELEYYNTYDESTYANNLDKNNQWRFLSEYFNKQNFDEVADSVFQTEKELRCMVYLQSDITTKQEFVLTQQQNKIFNVPSTWEFGDEGFTNFSRSADTPVRVLLQSPLSISDFYVKIFKEKNDTSVDFITNYDLEENKIDVSSVDNILKAPFEHNVVTIEGQVYQELLFNVDYRLIEDGVNYRMIAVGYEPYSTESIIGVSTTIQKLLSYPFDGNGINFRGTLSDVQREFDGDELTCVIEERIRTKMYLSYPYDQWKNDVNNRLGISTATNDIRDYLELVKVEIYEEYYDINVAGTVVNILQQAILSKIALNAYYSPDITATFNPDESEFEMTFRNKNDAGSSPISSTVNGLPYYNPSYPLGNQYWGGKDIFIKWRFGFKYPSFSDNIDYIQRLHVKDYDEGIEITRVGSSVNYICQGDNVCFEALITASIPDFDTEQFLLINTVENISLPLQEEEAFVGPELPQQTNAFINTQDVLYHGTPLQQGDFCVDSNGLLLNWNSKFSAMAKKNYTY